MAHLGEKFSQHAKGIGTASTGLSLRDQKPTFTQIPLSQIEADPGQPRRDLGDLSELSASIRGLGIIQPIIVTVVGYEKYRILAGERRFSAAGLAGLTKIPAIVRSVEEHTRLELQLVENLHRKDLNACCELDCFSMPSEQIGELQGWSTQASVEPDAKVV